MEGSGMDPEGYQALMQEAAKMKNAELEQKRKDWIRAPDFLKRTLTNADEVKACRALGTFAERLVFVSRHKDNGNDLCQDGKFEEAVEEYALALSVLLWFHLPNGRHSEEIPLHVGYNAFEASGCRSLARESAQVVLLNIAHCLNKLRRWDASVYACTYVIDRLDRHCVKALYRRAVAYYGQGTSFSLDQAVEDLLSASSVDPEDPQVTRLLTRYMKEKLKQDKKDSTIWKRSFARMKERAGEDYNDEQDVEDSHHGAGLAPSGKVGSLVAWSRRNPLLFAVYLLIFGHAAYRIALILTSPVGLAP